MFLTARSFKPSESIRIVGEGLGQNLQRYVPVELRVSGLPDLAHAAFAELGDDLVEAEGGAGLQRHPNFSRAYWMGVAPAGAPVWVTATALVDWNIVPP